MMASQVFSGGGLAAGITVGALPAADMLGTSSLSGLAAGLFTAGIRWPRALIGEAQQPFIFHRIKFQGLLFLVG